jgi:colanic acid/amylovoran biosynthesis glycosyltransferase
MKRIAIYSKEIPTTTFIENLVTLLSENGYHIFLFGHIRKRITYNGRVTIIPSPQKGWILPWFVAYHWFILLFKKPSKSFHAVKVCWASGGLGTYLRKLSLILPVLNTKLDFFHIQWANDLQSIPEFFELLDCPIDLSLRGAHINYAPLVRAGLGESYQKYFPSIRRFHAVSKAIGKEAEKYEADSQKIQVVYSSVKPEIISQFEPRTFCNRAEPKLVSVGRFHWKKGYQYALEALHQLKKEGINAHYTIVAQGSIPEEIIYMIHELELKQNVSIINGLPQSEIIKLLKTQDLFILPSVEEGIANVVLEAMAVGTPVISTDCGGMVEAIQTEVNGYIVATRDVLAIVDTVKKYIQLPLAEITSLSENAYKTILRQHTHQTMLEGFKRFYEN